MRLHLLFLFISLFTIGCNTSNKSNETKTNTETNKNINVTKEDTSIISETNYEDDGDYSDFIDENLINKIQRDKGENYSDEIIYLGDITATGNKISVLTVYKEVQAAITIHGHSIIYFLNHNKKIIKAYYLSMPDELPYKLENSILYFHYRDKETNKEKTYTENLSNGLPRLICVEPESCY